MLMFMHLAIILSAKYLFLVSIIIFLVYLAFLWKQNKSTCLSVITLAVITFPISLVIAKISNLVINDPRPFVVEHVTPLIAHGADNGFPSDHMLLTMAIASVVFAYNRRLGILLTIIACLVGAARVLAKVHHVEDILGSSLIAIVITGCVYYCQRYYKKTHSY